MPLGILGPLMRAGRRPTTSWLQQAADLMLLLGTRAPSDAAAGDVNHGDAQKTLTNAITTHFMPISLLTTRTT